MPWGPAPTFDLVVPSDAGPNDPAVTIGQTMPPELIAFYAPATVVNGIIMRKNAQTYIYDVLVVPTVGLPFRAVGTIESIAFTIVEEYRIQPVGFGGARMTFSGDVFLTGAWRIDGLDAPRGFLGGQSCAPGASVTMATSAAVGTEVAVPAGTWTGSGQPTFNFLPGRLYRVPISCNLYASNAGNRAKVQLRKIGGGALLISKYATLVNAPGAVESHDWTCYLQNLTAATVSTQIDMTVTMVAGAGNVNLFAEVLAASIAPTEFAIEDIGSVASNPSLANAARAV
jgi:hypothetical protein